MTRSRVRALAAIAAVLAPLAVGAAPSPEVVTVGTFSVAPYMMADASGDPHGALIDFFDREIAPRMGVRFKWGKPVTVARLEQSLIRGDVMFTPVFSFTEQRKSAGIVFAGDVHVHFDPCIVVLPSYRLDAIASPDDLAGMTIGWVNAAAMPEFLHKAPVKFDLIASVDWERANLEKLRLGRIQGAFFSDQFTPRFYGAQLGMALKVLKLPAPGTQLYGAFSPKVSPELMARYEKAARAAFANGRWETYLNKAVGAPAR